jgi:hypothetical protein
MISSSYRARFISALRGDEDIENFAKYAAVISAETIEYSAEIEHPSDRLITIFEKLSNMFARDRSHKQSDLENERKVPHPG